MTYYFYIYIYIYENKVGRKVMNQSIFVSVLYKIFQKWHLEYLYCNIAFWESVLKFRDQWQEPSWKIFLHAIVRQNSIFIYGTFGFNSLSLTATTISLDTITILSWQNPVAEACNLGTNLTISASWNWQLYSVIAHNGCCSSSRHDGGPGTRRLTCIKLPNCHTPGWSAQTMSKNMCVLIRPLVSTFVLSYNHLSLFYHLPKGGLQ